MYLQWALATLAVISLGLTVWQFLVAWRFPLHQRADHSAFAPGITLLKPLKGADQETGRCLESWLSQDYGGPVQILFGVAAGDDPVCELVRRLMAANPGCDAELVICPERLGLNAKVSTLVQLEKRIRHDVVIVSDADVWAPSDLLRQMGAALLRGEVGLVNCFYRLANPANLAMRLEALAVNGDFWGQVLQSRCLKPLDYALGAAMATSRAYLTRIGGFAGLMDHLADDYQLGNRIARAGGRIELCPAVVECRTGVQSPIDVWHHQLRWARTIRVCQPVPYFFSILSNATLWPLVWLLVQPQLLVLIAVVFGLGVRTLTAEYCERKINRRRDFNSLWLALLKDGLHAIVWAYAFLGSEVNWRGEKFRVLPGGKLARR